MDGIRVIPYHTNGGGDDGPNPRVETGAISFNEDWAGLFLRGKHAFALMVEIDRVNAILGVNHPDRREMRAVANIIRRYVIQGPTPPEPPEET